MKIKILSFLMELLLLSDQLLISMKNLKRNLLRKKEINMLVLLRLLLLRWVEREHLDLEVDVLCQFLLKDLQCLQGKLELQCLLLQKKIKRFKIILLKKKKWWYMIVPVIMMMIIFKLVLHQVINYLKIFQKKKSFFTFFLEPPKITKAIK